MHINWPWRVRCTHARDVRLEHLSKYFKGQKVRDLLQGFPQRVLRTAGI